MSAAPTPERRRDDRRAADRRRDFAPTAAEDSLFDALGVSLDAAAPVRQRTRSGEPSIPGDSGPSPRAAPDVVSAGSNAFVRLYRTFIGARAVLGLALLAAQVVGQALSARGQVGVLISLAYAVQAITLWLLPRFRIADAAPARLSRRRWLATIGFDLLAFSALHAFDPSPSFNYVALLVLPALMAGTLTPRVPAVATAAAASLVLLAAAWRGGAAGIDPLATLTPAGLMGIGLFVVTLLAGELSGRLAREEVSARGSLELARQQAQLNRLVIEEMVDGVMVIDQRARVRALNPAARRLLVPQGLARAAPFQLDDEPAWSELAACVAGAFASGRWPEGGNDAVLHFAPGQSRTLRLRARFTRARHRGGNSAADSAAPVGETLCVLFLEDLRAVQARSRQEKLAAMGRVSAGIAHEIRNPLAAIAQANALLAETAGDAEQRMLTGMVADNVERLKRIVDDVMEVAPGSDATLRAIDLGDEVGRIVADWARTSDLALGEGSRLFVRLPDEPLPVLFDPEHLRRVLVNLLDNARRHASARPGAITLVAHADAQDVARLAVASDGDPIPPDIEPYLFEPFFSTRSRGTGLGLYICRELCERYGGSIEYWQHPAGSTHRNEFVVTMRVSAEMPSDTIAARLI